jgi:hypothetical protein
MAKKQEETSEEAKKPRVQRAAGPRKRRLNKDQRDTKKLKELHVNDLVRSGVPRWKAKALASAIHF